MILDLKEDIIVITPSGDKYKLNMIGKKRLFSFLWRDNSIDKIPDKKYTRKEE